MKTRIGLICTYSFSKIIFNHLKHRAVSAGWSSKFTRNSYSTSTKICSRLFHRQWMICGYRSGGCAVCWGPNRVLYSKQMVDSVSHSVTYIRVVGVFGSQAMIRSEWCNFQPHSSQFLSPLKYHVRGLIAWLVYFLLILKIMPPIFPSIKNPIWKDTLHKFTVSKISLNGKLNNAYDC